MARRQTVPQTTIQRLSPWYSAEFLESVTVLRGSLLGWLFGKFGQHAVTINETVHLAPDAPDLTADSGVVLLGHECLHVEQQRDMGWWRFLARYVVRWRPSHIKNGRTHPFERPAYERGREIRASLRV